VGLARGIQSAPINAANDGANTIVAALAGAIRVISYCFTCTQPANPLIFQEDDGTLLAKFTVAANGGVSFPGPDDSCAFQARSGKALQVVNPVGVDTFGHLAYVVV